MTIGAVRQGFDFDNFPSNKGTDDAPAGRFSKYAHTVGSLLNDGLIGEGEPGDYRTNENELQSYSDLQQHFANLLGLDPSNLDESDLSGYEGNRYDKALSIVAGEDLEITREDLQQTISQLESATSRAESNPDLLKSLKAIDQYWDKLPSIKAGRSSLTSSDIVSELSSTTDVKNFLHDSYEGQRAELDTKGDGNRRPLFPDKGPDGVFSEDDFDAYLPDVVS